MAYVDSTTASGTSGTPSVAVPTGAAAGDIVILAASVDILSAVFDPADWPTGFTELAEGDNSLDGHSAAIGWKRLTAADTGTYTFGSISGSSPNWVCQAFLFNGRHATDPAVVSTTATNNTGNASPVTVTANGVTAVAGDDLLWFASADKTASGTATFAPPAGYTEREDSFNGFAAASGATKENVTAGATGTVAGTLTLAGGTSGYTAWLVRIPAAAGGSPNAGTGAGTFTFTGTASGSRAPKGSGSGSVTFTGAASGKRTPKGSGSGGYAYSGAASGVAPLVGAKTGSGVGAYQFAGTAAGSRTSRGTGSGSFAFMGTASGSAPTVGGASGSGSGAFAFTGAAIGAATHRGDSIGSYTFAGVATGANGEAGPRVSVGPPAPLTYTATLAPLRHATTGPTPLRYSAGRPT